MQNKTYIGTRTDDDLTVVRVEPKDGQPYWINPRVDLANHSPTGLNWGYAGSGPAQLALALAADYYETPSLPARGKALSLGDAIAYRLHQYLKHAYVSQLPKPGFRVTTAQLKEIIDAIFIKHGILHDAIDETLIAHVFNEDPEAPTLTEFLAQLKHSLIQDLGHNEVQTEKTLQALQKAYGHQTETKSQPPTR